VGVSGEDHRDSRRDDTVLLTHTPPPERATHPTAGRRDQGPRHRVVLVAQHTLLADALQIALSVHSLHLTWIDPTPVDAAPALAAAVTRSRPGTVLVDTDVRSPSGPAELIRLAARSGIPVVALTPYDDRREAGRWLAQGAAAVVSKQLSLSELTDVVRRLQRGSRVLDPHERTRLVRQWQHEETDDDRRRQGLVRLSPREEVVLSALMHGHTVADVAATEHVSVETVRSQVKSILAKLGVGSQVAAVGVAYRARWSPRGGGPRGVRLAD